MSDSEERSVVVYQAAIDFVMQDDDTASRNAVKRKFVNSGLSEDNVAVVKDCAAHFLRNCDKLILSKYGVQPLPPDLQLRIC